MDIYDNWYILHFTVKLLKKQKQKGIMYNFILINCISLINQQVISNIAFCQLFRFYFCGAAFGSPAYYEISLLQNWSELH